MILWKGLKLSQEEFAQQLFACSNLATAPTISYKSWSDRRKLCQIGLFCSIKRFYKSTVELTSKINAWLNRQK